MPNLDPLKINERIYRQLAKLLEQMETSEEEHLTFKERFQALMVIARIQYVFVNLRKEKIADAATGSAVRKYATAFKANDPRRGKKVAGARPIRAAKPEPDDIERLFDDDPDDGDAA